MIEADPISILLVDDKPSNLVALEVALAGVDCRLVTAQSGLDALKCVLVQDFAVILLDIAMPRMDGYETANLIRSRERSVSTPIIFLTAYDKPVSGIEEGYRLGAIDYIYKPFDPYILRAKVAFFVELFRKSVALEQRTADLTKVTADLVRALEQTAKAEAEAEMAAGRASVLAEVSRVLVENFMDHGPMLGRLAHIAALATGTACVIQLSAVDGDDAGLVPLAIDHTDDAVRAELARVLSVPHKTDDFPWQNLDRDFLDLHPLMDSLSVPMLAGTAMIGVLSLGRFGSGAAQFTESERRLFGDLAARVAMGVQNVRRCARMIEERARHLARQVEQVLDV